ncbi:MAG: SCO1664 family protein [Actinobacteria bacterium]|nr:SCO1664 family protein [Actinomycetota bacterium]
MPWSSNGTFLVEVGEPADEPAHTARAETTAPAETTATATATGGGSTTSGSSATAGASPTAGPPAVRAIYKPQRGERPLWDFPRGLWRREVAAYELAEALGWRLVPPTVARHDAPLGVGSLQLFVDAEFDEHYFTLLEDESLHPQLRRLCAFDVVANSTDRKSGHVLVDADRHLWAIDNGLAFAAEMKLRTVIWDFAGEAVDAELRDDLCQFLDRELPPALADLLDPFERDALRTRARALVTEGRFPVDHTGRRYPWPLV